MADLDSTSKRRSSVQLLNPFVMSPLLPDGTIAQADRQHVAVSYSGIAATSGHIFRNSVLNGLGGTGQHSFNPSLAGT